MRGIFLIVASPVTFAITTFLSSSVELRNLSRDCSELYTPHSHDGPINQESLGAANYPHSINLYVWSLTTTSSKLTSRPPDQIASAIEGFIWPKVFWDFISRNLDAAVNPIPILQILNLVTGLIGLAWEWPLKPFAGSILHRSIEIRLIVYPLNALFAALLYQGTDPAIYYLVGIGVYFWAYSEGEVCHRWLSCGEGQS